MLESGGSFFDGWCFFFSHRNRSRPLLAHFRFDVRIRRAGVHVDGLRRLRNFSRQRRRGDEFALAPIPLGQHRSGGCTAKDAWVNQAREAHVRDMTRGAEDALEIPDRLCSVNLPLRSSVLFFSPSPRSRLKENKGVRFRVQIIQETPAILRVEDAREPPGLILEGLHVLDLDEQNVAGRGALDVKGTRQVVDLGQVDVLDVVGRVVVADLPAGPVETFDLDDFVVGDAADGGDCLIRFNLC
jgi:hypothetical protein